MLGSTAAVSKDLRLSFDPKPLMENEERLGAEVIDSPELTKSLLFLYTTILDIKLAPIVDSLKGRKERVTNLRTSDDFPTPVSPKESNI